MSTGRSSSSSAGDPCQNLSFHIRRGRAHGTDLVSRARLDAAAGLHSADWLMGMPIASCGLALDNEAVRVAVGLRLGLDLCGPTFEIAGRRCARRATMDLYAENLKADHNVLLSSTTSYGVGHGGALVEATSFDRRVVGSNPALAAM